MYYWAWWNWELVKKHRLGNQASRFFWNSSDFFFDLLKPDQEMCSNYSINGWSFLIFLLWLRSKLQIIVFFITAICEIANRWLLVKYYSHYCNLNSECKFVVTLSIKLFITKLLCHQQGNQEKIKLNMKTTTPKKKHIIKF
jgi:hypothetical protein